MKKLLILITLFITGFNATGQTCNGLTTLQGKQFMCGGQPFYPIVCAYSTYATFNVPNNWNGNFPIKPASPNDVYLSPNINYGPIVNTANVYHVAFDATNEADCSAQILDDLTKIKSMGFNTIRTHFVGASHDYVYQYLDPFTGNTQLNHYCNLPNDIGQFLLLNSATSAGYWQGEEMNFGIPFSTQPSVALIKEFHFYDQLLTIAAQCSLKVLLDVGYENVTDDDIITSYKQYLIYLNQYINGLSANAQNALLAFVIVEEPFYEGQAEPTVTKNQVCNRINDIYSILDPLTNHLIAIGGDDLIDIMLWDPGILKIDFWCPHFYPIFNKDIETSSQLAVERVMSQLYWLKNNCPLPWIIGETSFSAIDDELTNNNVLSTQTYPEVNGSLQEQKQYAVDILKNVRDCGGSGVTWWHYQEEGGDKSFANGQGLLRHEDYLTNAGNPANQNLNKPVVDAFQNYLTAANNWNAPPIDQNGCPQPTHYYDPYNHAAIATNVYSQAHKVNGDVFDENGNPVKDAIVYGYTWTEYVGLKNHYDLNYTFTDANGHFELIPLNTKDQTDNTQFVNYVKVGAVGKKNSDFGYPWPPPPNDLVFEPDYLNGTNIPFNVASLDLNCNYTNYDCKVKNYTVFPDFYAGQQNDFQGINSLTASNFDVYGGTYASTVELKARKEVTIKATTSSTFYSGSEVLIYNTTELPDCIDNVGYRIGGGDNNQNEQKRTFSKAIEIKFAGKVELQLTAQPNPSMVEFNVTVTDPTEASYQIKVFDSFSRELFQTVIPPTYVLNLSAHPTGIYFLQVQSSSSLKTIKLIKQ